MAQGKFRDGGVSRRNLLQLGALAGSSVLIPGLGNIGWAYAQDKPALGTWPAGWEGDTVRIGAAVPLTGAYAVQGADELKGMVLAVTHQRGPRVDEGDCAQGRQRAARKEGRAA